MPRPIKDNKNFEISRSIVYNGKDNNFHMASMSACTDHFEIGFLISGSHHVYSTDGEWDVLKGYVGTIHIGLSKASHDFSVCYNPHIALIERSYLWLK